MKNLELFINPATGNVSLYIITRAGHKVVDLISILLFKAEGNYTTVFLTDGKEILISKTLHYIENLLRNHHFFRRNRSCMINLKVQGAFNRYRRKIYIANHEISVSKQNCQKVFPALTAYGFKEILRH